MEKGFYPLPNQARPPPKPDRKLIYFFVKSIKVFVLVGFRKLHKISYHRRQKDLGQPEAQNVYIVYEIELHSSLFTTP